eukprot:76556-Chlamydomonas_euryale.AAC.3
MRTHLRDLLLVELEAAQEVRTAIVDVHRLHQAGVAATARAAGSKLTHACTRVRVCACKFVCMYVCTLRGCVPPDCNRLETEHEQCGSSSLELMVHKRTLQWRGHVWRMDEDRLPRQVFDCSLARSVTGDGRAEQMKLNLGHRILKTFSGMYSSAIRGCHEESSGGGTTFRDFLKLPGHTKLIPRPEVRAAAAEGALGRQAWRDTIKTLLRWNLRSLNRLDV